MLLESDINQFAFFPIWTLCILKLMNCNILPIIFILKWICLLQIVHRWDELLSEGDVICLGPRDAPDVLKG